MIQNKTHIYLDDLSVQNLEALQAHYQGKHGLTLSASAVIRRSVAELIKSLGLTEYANSQGKAK